MRLFSAAVSVSVSPAESLSVSGFSALVSSSPYLLSAALAPAHLCHNTLLLFKPLASICESHRAQASKGECKSLKLTGLNEPPGATPIIFFNQKNT
ncbi:hypothetical protein ABVT39_006434 [Epinephelus coioides]